MRLVQEREKHLEQLDRALAKGLADIKAGRSEDAVGVFERVIAEFEKRSSKPAA